MASFTSLCDPVSLPVSHNVASGDRICKPLLTVLHNIRLQWKQSEFGFMIGPRHIMQRTPILY